MKIFGIGLSRTGTASLSAACEILGLRSKHYPPIVYRFNRNWGLKHRDLQAYDAFSDISVIPIYKQLDRRFPGSKFILTVREKESWLTSCGKFGRFKGDFKASPKILAIRRAVYGCEAFDRDLFSDAYDRHYRDVRAYFGDRCKDLLVLDICAEPSWDALCGFLGMTVPAVPFPHANRGAVSNA